MKRFRILMASVLVLMFVASLSTVGSTGAAPTISGNYDPTTLIVRLAPGADKAAVMAQHGLTEQGVIYGTQDLVVRVANVPAALAALSKNPNVAMAEPNYIATIDMTPNDTSWSSQWGPQKISAPAAWDVTQGSSSVIIAVVDTGVDLNHPDLSTKIVTGWDFVNNDGTPQDDHGHGTHVAGTAAAITNNSRGIAGICPNCKIMPVKVLDSAGSGTYANIASGIRYAADHGAKVINMSLGGSSGSTALSDAVTYANGKGLLLACAAGNSNTSAASYPAYYSACVAVAATDSNDVRASFSNYGSWVDTSAPGVNIYATVWNDSYTTMSGTSMATPHVAGLAGLLFSQGRTQSDVRTRLTNSTYTDPVGSTNIPRRINAYKAVAY